MTSRLPAELDALASHEDRARVTADLARRAHDSHVRVLRAREAELHAAIDRYHAALDDVDRWFSLTLAAVSCIEPARDRDDAERSEASRRRVA